MCCKLIKWHLLVSLCCCNLWLCHPNLLDAVKVAADGFEDGIRGLGCINAEVQIAMQVILDERLCLPVICIKSLLQRLRIVIRSLNQRFSSYLTNTTFRICLVHLLIEIRLITLLCDHSQSKTRLSVIINLIGIFTPLHAMPASAQLQWRNWGFRRPGAEAVKCAPLESRHVSLTPTVHFLVKYTTVDVPSRQLPCNSVIFL